MAVYLVGILLYGSIFEYNPRDAEEAYLNQKSVDVPDSIKSFSIISWNIGYCGLGSEMDFFYDGGEKVKTPARLVEKYSKGIADFIANTDSVDFFIFQEVDRKAARSSKLNEIELVEKVLPGFSSSFALNYQSFFVPIPILNPMGQVSSGLLNLSRYNKVESQRYTYYSSYAWPKKLFMPNRCFLADRFQLKDGKELIIINTHNSAFDPGGKLKEIEMPRIRDFMITEFEKGNYVIAGGDWNQNPPGFKPDNFADEKKGHTVVSIEKTFFPEQWQFVFDPEHPTNRNLDISWDKEKTLTTVIDFFIVSPNIRIETIKTINLDFKYSDHEPVFFQFVLL